MTLAVNNIPPPSGDSSSTKAFEGESLVVTPGQMVVASTPNVCFKVERLTSGVVVVALPSAAMLSDGKALSGMVHCSLPDSTSVLTAENASRVVDETHRPEWLYVDCAIPALLEALESQGGVLVDFRWIVAGGAQPFTFGGGNNTLNIGSRNIQAVQALLAQHGLPVVGESVGSNKARTLYTQPAGVTVQLLGGESVILL
ncbi:MAG: chemotaxis protein CheD [Vampirovibrionales bacterium]|nr:chemotaxis protein CheD [Vampirovibrionales bacterium]